MIARYYEKKGLDIGWVEDVREPEAWYALVGRAVLEAGRAVRHDDGSDDPPWTLTFRDGSRLELTHPHQIDGWGDARAFSEE